jgi:hypothetical protein
MQAVLSSPNGAIVGNTFNGLLTSFLNDLRETFPERQELSLAINALALAADKDPMQPLKAWLSSMEKLKEAGFEQPFFTECTEAKVVGFLAKTHQMHPLIALLPLEEMWNDPMLIDEDRAAIWEHLHQLELSSMAINAFEPGALAAIENLAKRYMTNLQGLNPQDIDIRALGMDVIKQVMSDEGIRAAIETPEAEKRFNSVMGDKLDKLWASGASSGPGAAGLPDLAGLMGNMPMPDAAQLSSMMQQMTGQTISQQDLAAMFKQMKK